MPTKVIVLCSQPEANVFWQCFLLLLCFLFLLFLLLQLSICVSSSNLDKAVYNMSSFYWILHTDVQHLLEVATSNKSCHIFSIFETFVESEGISKEVRQKTMTMAWHINRIHTTLS